ncbi:caldesmon isoform X7 [Ascaphus truei]|uniref:caldesmon isoform X7 n=1 Tax=Ascaphus truei TaxID=8439 RepID=UPI003F594874
MEDFEHRRELRRQKREEMRIEAERLAYLRNDDDEEEAARERRRRARQERQRMHKDDDIEGHVAETSEGHSQNSIMGEDSKPTTITNTDISGDDEAALLDKLAKREERRLKRLKEAMDRQKEFDPTVTDESVSLSKSNSNGENEVEENDTGTKEDHYVPRRGQYEDEETETVTKSYQKNDWREDDRNTDQAELKEDLQEEIPEPNLIQENQVKEVKTLKGKGTEEEVKTSWERKKAFPETKAQNGERVSELTSQKLKHTEKTFGPAGVKVQTNTDEADSVSKAEAEKKLKQKQQEAAVELEELKKRREERRKIQEEEEQKKKQEDAERKAKEEEEKKRLKQEIEKRRAGAAEKRQKVPDDGLPEEKKPFKCLTPKGSSFKIEERAEFLNKSAQKSSLKPAQPSTVVSKIDSRLEQYTSAIVSNKAAKPAKPAASDLPLPAEGVRNIKSMWEKGNVFSSPGGAGSPNKETAGLKVGVSSRINEWLTKTPESSKSPSSMPSDLRPGDVSGKRNIWEKQQVEKPGSPSKVTAGGKKSDTNGLRFEKEP